MIGNSRLLSASILPGMFAASLVTPAWGCAEGVACGARNVVLVHGTWADGSSDVLVTDT